MPAKCSDMIFLISDKTRRPKGRQGGSKLNWQFLETMLKAVKGSEHCRVKIEIEIEF